MTDSQSILKTNLLDLLHELRDPPMPLLLCGGYGLYLKQVYLQETVSSKTVIDGELWPAPRATQDLDILLTVEVVASIHRMQSIKAALDRLGYTAIPRAKYMQFAKPLGDGRDVKVDILTGSREAYSSDLKVKEKVRLKKGDERRVRPLGNVRLHARLTNEAVAFEENTMEIPVRGTRSNGQSYEGIVHIPQPFTLLLMKLHAFRDRYASENKDMGRHHALDLYRIVAMMTDDEFERTQQRVKQHQDEPAVIEACRIVAEHFESIESLGALRLQEHQLWVRNMETDTTMKTFLSAMEDLFQLQH